MADTIKVEVAYATADKQRIIPLTVTKLCRAIEAVRLSGIATEFPEINPETAPLGIFANLIDPDTRLHDGDRVEIYRPLIIDPKESRRQRATQAKAKRRGK